MVGTCSLNTNSSSLSTTNQNLFIIIYYYHLTIRFFLIFTLPYIFKWFESYLAYRSIKVVVDGTTSTTFSKKVCLHVCVYGGGAGVYLNYEIPTSHIIIYIFQSNLSRRKCKYFGPKMNVQLVSFMSYRRYRVETGFNYFLFI